MLRDLSAWKIIIVLLVVVLIFGANRLPGVAKSVGQSMKIFRDEMRDMRDDDDKGKSASHGDDSPGDTQPPKA